MATLRQIEAYRRRLAKVASGGASRLTPECLGAVVSVGSTSTEAGIVETVGTLVGYTHRQAPGLFGMQIVTDVQLCTACVGRSASCSKDDEIEVRDVWLNEIVRNASEDLAAAGLLEVV